MTFKELIDSVRPTALNDILNVHGLSGIRQGNSIRYKDETMNIVVTGDKWYDNKLAHGGVGPIDLVAHLKKCSFREAVLWLADKTHFYSLPQKHIQEKLPAEQMPYDQSKQEYALRDDSLWSEARSYLINTRCLKSEVVDECYRRENIYATSRAGIAFIHRNVDGEDVGLSIRAIKHQSGFRQSLGSKTTGWFTIGDIKSAQKIVIVESAIDALSFLSLKMMNPEMAIVAVSGAFYPLPLLKHAWENKAKIIAAYDSDEAGLQAKENLHEAWTQLTNEMGEFDTKMPLKKDWNEDLCCKVTESKKIDFAQKFCI